MTIHDPERPRFVAQMRKGMLLYCVLALIDERPNYGRALVDALAEIPGMATTYGTIYPLLGRLCRQRLVTSAPGPTLKGPRRYYRITDQGREALQAFGREWSTFRAGLEQVLARYEEPPTSNERATASGRISSTENVSLRDVGDGRAD